MIDARLYLEYIRALDIRIQMKMRQIQHMRDSLTSISSSTDQEHVSKTRNDSVMADTIAKIADIEKEIRHQATDLVAKKGEAIRLMDQLDADQANILSGYYLERRTTKELADSMYISRRQVERKISAAICEFQRVLSERQSPESVQESENGMLQRSILN